jgi:tetratricopeptide (TPR) repeat protein
MRPALCRLAGAASIVAAAAALAAQDARPPADGVAARLETYQPGRSVVPPLPREAQWAGAGDFRRDAAAWIVAGGPADAPRRRLLVATYVLDTVKDIEPAASWREAEVVPNLLEWACARLRESAPLGAEEAWHVAALALLERSSTVTALEHHLEHAENRVPAGERWPLVRALIDEWKSENNRLDDGTRRVSGSVASRAAEHFQQAAQRASVRQEALLRWAAFESDLGRQDAALAKLDAIGPLADPFLRYWLGVIKGRALRRAHRPEDAIAAYRSSIAELPSAQSAALGLAAALVSLQRLTEAADVAARAVAPVPASPPDPWTQFRSPDVRFWPSALDRIRAEVVR